MVKWGRTILGLLGLGYVVSPIDLIPEALLGPLGLLDDAVVGLVSILLIMSGITEEEELEKEIGEVAK